MDNIHYLVYNEINKFFINDTAKIILAYLIKFNGHNLIFQRSLPIKGPMWNLCSYKNELYFHVYGENILYVYDESANFISDIKIDDKIISLCNYKKNIYIATTNRILLHNDNTNIEICSISNKIEKMYCYKQHIVYSNYENKIIIYDSLKNNKKETDYEYNFNYDCIYLYKNYLYLYRWPERSIKVYDIYNNILKIKQRIGESIIHEDYFLILLHVNSSYLLLRNGSIIYIFYRDTFKFIGKIFYNEKLQRGFTFKNNKIYLLGDMTLKILC